MDFGDREKDLHFVNMIELEREKRLDEFLKNRQVLNTIESLYELAVSSGALEAESPLEQLAMSCSEAIRFAYRLSRELGIPQDSFMVGVGDIARTESEQFIKETYN